MDYQSPTHHQEQTGKGKDLGSIKECPHIRKRSDAAEQCELCSTKAKPGPELRAVSGSNESEKVLSYDEISALEVSDDKECSSAHEDQATSNNEEDIPYLDLWPAEPDMAVSDHSGPEEYYHNGNDLLDSGDGLNNRSGYKYGAKCTWHKFSRSVTRQLMPPNIPRTKATSREGDVKEFPLVPELKLTTPEGEDFWLDDLTYYGGQGGWAGSDDAEEDESIYD